MYLALSSFVIIFAIATLAVDMAMDFSLNFLFPFFFGISEKIVDGMTRSKDSYSRQVGSVTKEALEKYSLIS